ncbi:hypothetical protein SKAU_G00363730 [Synaphobranchus kaupii]|uniref:Uncharacterized protein n=1 Tax=Synaphobranchus kaupii TaxID=118154 RepID=A0A9Q1IH46_SYNKA|nr:hypothetical protein SKAU_G00363730 [Synaphobranchus kaupii]
MQDRIHSFSLSFQKARPHRRNVWVWCGPVPVGKVSKGSGFKQPIAPGACRHTPSLEGGQWLGPTILTSDKLWLGRLNKGAQRCSLLPQLTGLKPKPQKQGFPMISSAT